MTQGAAFRDLSADDVPEAMALCRESGWNQTEDDWRMLLEPPSVFRGAVVNGRVRGTAGAMIYGDALAWVCMVLVAKEWRGQGLGTRLVEQVLERLPAVDAVGLDATPKGQSVYTRLGFEPLARLTRLLATPSAETKGAASEARPLKGIDFIRLLADDAAAFGADRSRVLRAAFSSAPEYAWCVGRGRSTRAYGFGRHGANADHIGPVVAEGMEGAAAVVGACLAANPGRSFIIDAPDEPEWQGTLASMGFREQRPFTRMYRGGRAPSGQPARVFAAFGPELG